MGLIKKATKLGYKHYTDFTVDDLDKLPLSDLNKQIEYYFIQKWLRENHKLHVQPYVDNSGYYYIDVIIEKGSKPNIKMYHGFGYDTYEDAFEKGLYKALKLIEK